MKNRRQNIRLKKEEQWEGGEKRKGRYWVMKQICYMRV